MAIQIAVTPPIGGINMDKLRAELVAVYADVEGVSFVKPDYYVNLVNDSLVTQEQIQALVDVHNAANLTPEQAKALARTIMLSDAKNYLSTQLASANPNVTTIYNTIKAYVDSNAILSSMVTNQIALMQASHGWIINLLTPTSTDRARYIIACQMILASIA